MKLSSTVKSIKFSTSQNCYFEGILELQLQDMYAKSARILVIKANFLSVWTLISYLEINKTSLEKSLVTLSCLKLLSFYKQLLDQIMLSLSCAKNGILVPEKQSLSQIMTDNCQVSKNTLFVYCGQPTTLSRKTKKS